jgi:hypothetical protein
MGEEIVHVSSTVAPDRKSMSGVPSLVRRFRMLKLFLAAVLVAVRRILLGQSVDGGLFSGITAPVRSCWSVGPPMVTMCLRLVAYRSWCGSVIT